MGDRQLYTVVRGDTLYTIADRLLGTPSAWNDIALANPTVDPLRLAVGSTLVIPA
jgi:nucleoid-associated protein YgaU